MLFHYTLINGMKMAANPTTSVTVVRIMDEDGEGFRLRAFNSSSTVLREISFQ
jgi:hypothetical protein